MLDEFVWGDVTRISPEAPVPVVDIRRESVHLGGAANVLANIVALGAQACVLVSWETICRRTFAIKSEGSEPAAADDYLVVDDEPAINDQDAHHCAQSTSGAR
jgi:hypothetical protein